MKTKWRSIAAVVMAMLLSACSEPLPVDKLNYAGDWQSREMELLILTDGTVAYKRLQKGGTTSINAPLKEFQGNNFIVGIGPVTTTFIVAEPPTEVDGQWQMVVDGVRLTKAQN
ncbi:hypothetical protein [Corallincola luteus]|uniref:hypothetical protein n=1 Tax=Corallincola luteus TaxID=1775177 RepID=UPI001F0F55C4|nr:hypothetical protein [Corallincola luteus]